MNAYGNGPVLTEFGSLDEFMRSRPDLAVLHSLEGPGIRVNVLGMGSFAFLPHQVAPLLDFVQPSCWVGTIKEAMARLVIVASRPDSQLSRRLEGRDHV